MRVHVLWNFGKSAATALSGTPHLLRTEYSFRHHVPVTTPLSADSGK
uniref:Uncharacterized protein n=1 Tax=Coccidioides posadasii RMSCC 3488 TaxID=454284 RepID=A0A0J6INW2_COCPO|nr:hypothetical protein CPAG_09884 [Coccidioides posadasii RMSCC 3488]